MNRSVSEVKCKALGAVILDTALYITIYLLMGHVKDEQCAEHEALSLDESAVVRCLKNRTLNSGNLSSGHVLSCWNLSNFIHSKLLTITPHHE